MDGVKFSEYMIAKDAAEYLGVKINTLKNWARRGQINFVRHPISKYMLFRKEDLDELFIEEYES